MPQLINPLKRNLNKMASQISRELAQGVEADRWRANCSFGDFKGESFYKYGAVKCIMPDCFGKWADTIKNLQVKSDDIWVITFPKTGTTWTQELVWLVKEKDFKRAAELPIHQRFIFLEYGAFKPDLANEAPTLKKAAEMSSPRYIKSHLPFSLLPSSLVQGIKPKIVYVARNPKDACVSYYYHSLSMSGYRGTLEDFIRSFISDNALYSPYWGHLKEAYELRGNENILFLTYEEMKEDLRASIVKVASFLKKPLEDSELEALVHHLDFNSMKDNQAVNYESALKDHEVKYGTARSSNFMRKGEVGNWREKFSGLPRELLEEFDRWNKLNGIEGMWEKYL